MKPKPARYSLKTVKIPFLKRLRLWWGGVWLSLTLVPDPTFSFWAKLEPGDEGYDDAPYEQRETPWRIPMKTVKRKRKAVKK